MNKTDCKIEPLFNVTVGFVLLVIGLLFALSGLLFIPFIGLLVAIPVLIVSGIFLAAPRSKTCAIILQKTRGAINK
ncbi:MAG: hypothetical protein ACYSWP_20040 [Planctomycetota bacterium]|jgi:hypothetical protein